MRYFLIVLMAFFNTIHSQDQLSPDNLGDWEMVYNMGVTNNGRWMHYISQWTSGNDTIVVKEIHGKKEIKISKGRWGVFTENGRFFSAFTEDGNLRLLDLEKYRDTLLEGITGRSFSPDGKFLVATRSIGEKKELVIKNLAHGTVIAISKILEFSIHPSKNKIAIILTKENVQSLNILDLENYTMDAIKEDGSQNFSNLVWNDTGSYLAFSEVTKTGSDSTATIFAYLQESGRINKLPKTEFKDGKIVEGSLGSFDSCDYFFFDTLIPENDYAMDVGVQVWNTTDKWIYPQRQQAGLLGPQPTRWSWNPITNSVIQLTDSIGMELIPLNSDYILKYNKLAYEPQYKYEPVTDVYLHNLSSGKSELLLPKQLPDKVLIAPDGKTIVFFHERNWWAYIIAEKRKINLTENLPTSFFDSENDRNSRRTSFTRHLKWVAENTAILVSDEFDVWKLSVTGETKECLTKGREGEITFRPVTDLVNLNNIDQNIVNLKKGLLLEAKDGDRNMGCFLLQENGKIKQLTFGPFLVDEIKNSVNGDYISFRTQSYAQPPKIFYYNVSTASLKLLHESNPNPPLTYWGKTELFNFSLPNGESSKACLIYPVDYDPSKKYPMIVDVYERLTERMHEFHPISEYGTDGFNPTHYALDGYFVLYPDIHFEIGNPGLSALKYLEAALDCAIQKVSIDEDKLGLYGFSYGGYESAFIATQTDRFAAIVAGAAVTDMVTFYHAINWTTGQEEMWRLEDFQMRMGGSYFKNKEKYIKNSPFHSVEHVTSPLLLWCGGNDLHIDYHESIRFYLALRRLKKNARLLLLEDEGHNILDPKKQKYLSHAVKEWFDTYCK